jgi:hypothetical protein
MLVILGEHGENRRVGVRISGQPQPLVRGHVVDPQDVRERGEHLRVRGRMDAESGECAPRRLRGVHPRTSPTGREIVGENLRDGVQQRRRGVRMRRDFRRQGVVPRTGGGEQVGQECRRGAGVGGDPVGG